MRILFISSAIPTHLYVFAPLAWACRTAGHEVRVASMPALTPTTLAAGLTAVEVSEGYDILGDLVRGRGGRPRVVEPRVTRLDGSGVARPDAHARADIDGELRNRSSLPWVRAAAAMAPDLLRFAERWRPRLVISEPLVFAAPLVSATLGVPLVRHVWGPDMMRRIGYPLQGQPTGGEAWPAELVELFERYRVAIRDDHATRTIDPWPESLQLPGTPGRMPMRFVPYNGAAVAPDWVLDRPSRPRVCVTWGRSTSALGGDDAFVLPRVIDALAPLDVEAVLAVSAADRARLGAVPGNLRLVEDFPLHLVMPTCDAIVNQAGCSSLLTAASHGVPQVLLPQTADTPFNAANFSASGAAVTLDVATADAEAIGAAVSAAVADGPIRAAARKIEDEISAAPSPAAVVGALEDLA